METLFNTAMQNLYDKTLSLGDIPARKVLLDSVDPDDICSEFEYVFGIVELDQDKFLRMMERSRVVDIIKFLDHHSNDYVSTLDLMHYS